MMLFRATSREPMASTSFFWSVGLTGTGTKKRAAINQQPKLDILFIGLLLSRRCVQPRLRRPLRRRALPRASCASQLTATPVMCRIVAGFHTIDSRKCRANRRSNRYAIVAGKKGRGRTKPQWAGARSPDLSNWLVPHFAFLSQRSL
jgi:hypothetical protein